MCGIAGLISQNPKAFINSMLRSIEHRGRDDEGIWTSQPIDAEEHRVCLGHRRLSIIDTSSAGHQPMPTRDGRLVVILNGEIYNYRELREQLATKGHRFRTQTDTEVLLAAWAEWGDECLTRLNGMFAFALWDDKEHALYLVRDRVGIKPLYYADMSDKLQFVECSGRDARAPSAIVFASEIKSILASGLIRPELDHEALHQFLTFLWAPDPNTLFRGIKTVPPGHFVKIRDGQSSLRQWWDIAFDQIDEERSEAWWQERVLETLDRVVKLEMVADVPLGSFLSGGVDSSSIVAMMKRHSDGRRVGTYTIGIEAEDLRYDIIPDDVEWARRVKQKQDTDYQEIMLKTAGGEFLAKPVYHIGDAAKTRLYTDNLRDATRGMDAYGAHRNYFARVKNAAPLNQLLYVDLKTFLPCLNLMTTDKTSMAANLEVRVPFLNQEMLELAARMPINLKLRGLKRKYILKRAAEKLLPREVVWRKKAGFGAPIRSWLRGALRPMVDDLLSAETVKRRGLFRPEEVKRIIERNLSGREDYNLQVFQLLTFELWQRTFMDKG